MSINELVEKPHIGLDRAQNLGRPIGQTSFGRKIDSFSNCHRIEQFVDFLSNEKILFIGAFCFIDSTRFDSTKKRKSCRFGRVERSTEIEHKPILDVGFLQSTKDRLERRCRRTLNQLDVTDDAMLTAEV